MKALAAGDAIGKQTETLSREAIRQWYPGGITGFHGRPGDVIPRYRGKRYEWRIGETTDDTEQTLAVARALLPHGEAHHERAGWELLSSTKSVHPDLSIWRLMQSGNPARIAHDGDGCGAAMRIAPVGIVYRPQRMDDLVKAAYQCSIPTHGGQLAICAAAAVAAAISTAIEGLSARNVLAHAIDAARRAEPLGRTNSSVTMAECIEEIHAGLSAHGQVERYVPDNPRVIVPLAICLAVVTQSAEQTILMGANAGGDTDSVASIGGAIAGALSPDTVNEEWFEVVRQVNADDILSVGSALASLRH